MDAPPNPKRQRRQYDDSETRKQEIYQEFVRAAAKGDLETVQQMLEVDMIVPVDCLDGFNDQTALYAASTRGHVLVVQYLIQAGANVNWVARDGNTSLHSACLVKRNVAVVEALIQAGAEIDADRSGVTPLISLLHYSYLINYKLPSVEILRVLLSTGCDVNAADDDGCMALHYACGYDNSEEILHMLIEAGADLINGEKGRLLHRCVVCSALEKIHFVESLRH